MEKLILYVEDNADDVLFMQMAWREAKISARLKCVSDGQLAIDYLSDKSTALPALLLLDLKLPRKSGFDVLAWARGQPQLKRLLVVVLTSSDQPIDVNQAYDLGANSYLVKPGNVNELVELVKVIGTYWIQRNIQPAVALPGAKAPLFAPGIAPRAVV